MDAAQEAYQRLLEAQRANGFVPEHLETPEQVKRRRQTLTIRKKTEKMAPA